MKQNTEFKLGPIQEAWLKSLEEHPEKQHKGSLGIKHQDGSYQACCLGEACIILHKFKGTEPTWFNGGLFSDGLSGILDVTAWVELGLRGGRGEFKKEMDIKDSSVDALSILNDYYMTWPEIAAYIRANPENVFTKSV